MSVQNRRFLILLSAIAGVCVLAGVLWLVRNNRIATQMEEARARGLAAHAEGRYETSTLRDLNFFASRDRTDGEVLLALANTRRHIPVENGKHIVAAIAFAQASADVLPGDPRPYELLLELYSYTGFIGELLDTSSKLLAMDANHKEALQSKIRALRSKGDIDQALLTAQTLAAAHPDDLTSHLFVLDLMRLKQGAVDERVAYVAELARRRPLDPDILLLQARIAGSANDFDSAVALVRRVADMELTSPTTLAEAVRLMDLLRLSDEAVAMLEKQAQNPALSDAAALLAAERGWKSGMLSDAQRALTQLVANPAEASDGALGLAALLKQSGQLDVPGDPENALRKRTTAQAVAWAQLLDARNAMAKGDLDAARSTIERIDAQVIPDIALFTRGQIELARAEPARAAETFEDAIRIEPRWLELRMLRIATLTDLGRLPEAIEEAQKCAVMFPRRLEPYNALARVTTLLIESGRASARQVDTVLELLDRLAEENLDKAAVVGMRARVLVASGREAEAAEAIAQGITAGIDPASGALSELLAVARRLQRDELVAQLESLIAAGPNTPSLALERAMAAASQGRVMEGAAHLRDAVASAEPEDRLAYERALAIYLERNGDPESLTIRKRLAAEQPTSLTVQIDVLRSEQAWADQATIVEALDRIKSLAGAESTVWKLGEARRLLTFERSEANAAGAASILNDVIRAEPENLQALLLLAEANLALGDPSTAVTLMGRAVDAAPREASLYPRLIRMLQESGAAADAERRLNDFVKFTDISPDLMRQRAQLLVFQAMWTEAEADLRAIAAGGQWRDQLALAEFFAARGRPDEAASVYDAVVAGDEVDTSGLLAAAEFYAGRGDTSRANQLLERVRASTPEMTGRLITAGYEERRGRLEEAESQFRNAAVESNDANVWAELAAFYIRQSQMEKAREAVNSGRKADTSNATLASLDRLLSAAAGEIGAAAVDQNGLDPVAMEVLRIQNSRPPAGADTSDYLGRLAALARANPTYFAAWSALVREALAFNQTALAANTAQEAARAMPSDPRAAQLAAETLALTGQISEAIAMTNTWKDRAMRDPFEPNIFLARLHSESGRPAESLAILEANRQRLLASPGAHVDVISLYVSLLAGAGRLDEARAIMEQDGHSADGKAQLFLAIARGLYGQPEEARSWLLAANGAVDTSNPSHAIAMAQVWFDLAGSRGGLPSDYEQTIAVAGPHADDEEIGAAASGLLATSYDQTGRFAEAERAYRAVLDANPDQPVILNNLAFLLLKSQSSGGGEEAVRLASRAIGLAQSLGLASNVQASMMDTLGAAQLRADRAGDSAQTYRDALNLLPDDPELVSGLTLALTHLDRDQHQEEINSLIARFSRLARTRIVTPTAAQRMDAVQGALQNQ